MTKLESIKILEAYFQYLDLTSDSHPHPAKISKALNIAANAAEAAGYTALYHALALHAIWRQPECPYWLQSPPSIRTPLSIAIKLLKTKA